MINYKRALFDNAKGIVYVDKIPMGYVGWVLVEEKLYEEESIRGVVVFYSGETKEEIRIVANLEQTNKSPDEIMSYVEKQVNINSEVGC